MCACFLSFKLYNVNHKTPSLCALLATDKESPDLRLPIHCTCSSRKEIDNVSEKSNKVVVYQTREPKTHGADLMSCRSSQIQCRQMANARVQGFL